MSEPKFTKGPWSIARANRHDPEEDICDDRGYVLAHMKYHDAEDVITEEETEANAGLIAAAPDLYAALDACLDLIHNVGESHTVLFDQVVNALAKARGEVSDA